MTEHNFFSLIDQRGRSCYHILLVCVISRDTIQTLSILPRVLYIFSPKSLRPYVSIINNDRVTIFGSNLYGTNLMLNSS